MCALIQHDMAFVLAKAKISTSHILYIYYVHTIYILYIFCMYTICGREGTEDVCLNCSKAFHCTHSKFASKLGCCRLLKWATCGQKLYVEGSGKWVMLSLETYNKKAVVRISFGTCPI